MKKINIILFALVLLVTGGFILQGNNFFKPDQNVGLNIGDKAPEIDLKDPDGKTIKLSSLKGYIVLIDFWAAWCGPCRRENPYVVKAYNEFKDKKMKGGKKGFRVYSVSLDRDKNQWVTAIAQDGLIWKEHVSDLQWWSSVAAKTYGINSIPSNYLIDGEGIIIAKNLRGEMLLTQLERLVQ